MPGYANPGVGRARINPQAMRVSGAGGMYGLAVGVEFRLLPLAGLQAVAVASAPVEVGELGVEDKEGV